VTPYDLGMAWIVSETKGDFVGRRSLHRPELRRRDRKQFVGLLPESPDELLPEGAQLVVEPGDVPPVPMIGHVTSSYRSAALGRTFALALLKGGSERHGETVFAPLGDRLVTATVTMAVVLLVGAGLLLRSFAALMATESGFQPNQVLTIAFDLPREAYPRGVSVLTFAQNIVGRVKAVPGVRAASISTDVPLESNESRAMTAEASTQTGPSPAIIVTWSQLPSSTTMRPPSASLHQRPGLP